jgi:hypothetical protein
MRSIVKHQEAGGIAKKRQRRLYFFLPLRVVVVVVDVVTRPLFFAQAGEQYHVSGGGCFNPTHGKWNWKGKKRTMRDNSAEHMLNETNPFVRTPIIIIAGNHL